jgi:hypothetical protein
MAFNPIGVSDYERWAIHEFFLRVTLPILFRKDENVGIVGNGTLFKIAGRSFLITAGHIMDDYPVADWAFPTHPRKGRSRGISTGVYVRPPDPALDVCVVELQDPDVIATLDKNWKFLTLNNVWLADLSANAILLAGYPSIRAQFDGENLSGKIFIVRQQYKDGDPDIPEGADPLSKGIDFFINYQDAVNEYTEENISRVHIGGMSGCSVWAYRQIGWAPHTFWSPEVPLRVIGIQSGYVAGKYLRAKSWGAILNTLAGFDDAIKIERDEHVARMFERLDQSARKTF